MPTRPRRGTATSSRLMPTPPRSLCRSRTFRRRIPRRAASSRCRYWRPCASSQPRCASAPEFQVGNFPPLPPFLWSEAGQHMSHVMDYVSRGMFAVAAAVLMLIALALSGYCAFLLVGAFRGPWDEAGTALLGAIGYVVIAVAVFDVSKYFVEEEVIRGREMRMASEARRSLTKFVSTISIAVFIEGLVMVFRESNKDVAMVLYPAVILGMGILTILGLGLYQRMSAGVEAEVEARDRAQDKDDRKTK